MGLIKQPKSTKFEYIQKRRNSLEENTFDYDELKVYNEYILIYIFMYSRCSILSYMVFSLLIPALLYSNGGLVVLSEQKKILISLPDTLLSEVDEFIRSEKLNRSEFVREAMKLYIKERRRIEIREKMKKGYEEMGKINLKFAEMCFEADCMQCFQYERKLAECE